MGTHVDQISLGGFSEPISVRDLIRTGCDGLPRLHGIYLVIRKSDLPPDFRQKNTGGKFKGRNPTVPCAKLQAKWVDSAKTVYVGKAAGKRGLQQRLGQLLAFGCGKPVGHWGGRYLWQLMDSDDLLICWRECDDAKQAETDAIAAFKAAHKTSYHLLT